MAKRTSNSDGSLSGDVRNIINLICFVAVIVIGFGLLILMGLRQMSEWLNFSINTSLIGTIIGWFERIVMLFGYVVVCYKSYLFARRAKGRAWFILWIIAVIAVVAINILSIL